MFRSVLSSILAAALLTGSSAPVSASTPAGEGNTLQDHVELVRGLERAGLRVYFNPKQCLPEGGLCLLYTSDAADE